MGIYDRDYARAAPPGRGGFGGSRLVGLRFLSFNTWLIIINAGIFLLAPRQLSLQYGHFSTLEAFTHFEVWRLVTFQFLHLNQSHVFFNMFGLFVFGGIVEQHLGSKRYVAFYLMCGIGGGLMYLLLNFCEAILHIPIPGNFTDPATPLIGASAGVFGVIMACAYISPTSQILLFFVLPLKMKTLAYGYVAISAYSLLTGSQNAGGEAAHLGGALAGFYFIRNSHLLRDFFDVMGDSRRPPKRRKPSRAKKRPKFGARPPNQDEVDRILDKVHSKGVHSLSESEKKTLKKASDTSRR